MATPDELEPTARTAYLVGMISREFSRLEYAAGALLHALIDNPGVGEVIAFGHSIGSALDQIDAITKHPNNQTLRQAPFFAQVRGATASARGVVADRNVAVHGLWLYETDQPAVFQLMLARRLGRQVNRTLNLDDLRSILERVSAAADAMTEANEVCVFA